MMWWLIGGGLALVLLWRHSAQAGAVNPDDSPEWLARVVLLESGDIGPGDEWAGIMQVALNRQADRRYGDTLRAVVATTDWPGGGARGEAFVEAVQAPGGQGYRSAYGHPAPPDHRRWSEALAMAWEMARGLRPNPIGARKHFFHPGGMPSCQENGQWSDDERKLCVSGRWWPRWSVEQYAEYEPIRVGRAVFS